MIVALRALRNGAADDTREVVDRTLAKLGGGRRGPVRPARWTPARSPVVDAGERGYRADCSSGPPPTSARSG